jgi:hypothetical protein
MVITGALLLQLAAAAVPDSTYSSAALRDFVARAAAANAAPPPALRGYQARIETEIGLVARDPLGREESGSIEQLAAQATWSRDGSYDVHVIGYRAMAGGSPVSALNFTRTFSVPVLYGNRLAAGMNDGIARRRDTASAPRRRGLGERLFGRPPSRSVHPLAPDRDRHYRFRGGDTVAVLTGQHGRRISIMRVHVEPVDTGTVEFTGFRGELDFDADRHQIVRMRGTFEAHRVRKDPLFVRAMDVTGVAFVEFENAEVDGKYWLPHRQRTELQSHMGFMGELRSVYRLVSRFSGHALLEDTVVAADTSRLPPTRARLTWAGGDSASRFANWLLGLGAATNAVHADDFNDLAPAEWQPTGEPRIIFWPRNPEDVLRFNRIEGLFTGASVLFEPRDAAPGLSLYAFGGWGWSERSPRGGAEVRLDRDEWRNSVYAARFLARTGDLTPRFEDDYVDRYSAGWQGIRRVGTDRALMAASLGYVADRYAPATILRAPVGGGAFRPNRLVHEGEYLRGMAAFELNPRVSGYSLAPGVGARARYEVANGELDWHRVDVRLAARRYWSGLLFSSRLDAGLVASPVIPPQALFEIGGGLELPSYGYKEFGGDRAALAQGAVAYYFPAFRRPVRRFGLMLPGLNPGIGVGVQGGWAEASTSAARTALLALGGDGVTPLSRPTERIRSTIDVRTTFFSGILGFGFARPLDHSGPWKFFLGGGSSY